MKLLLDTNICIYLIKRRPSAVRARFEEHEVRDIGLSSVAHAKSLGATLVTSNVREFERVEGLTIENWAKAEA